MTPAAARRSLPYPLGVTLRDGGANVAIYSQSADAVEICTFDGDGAETRTVLPERTGHVFHGMIPGIEVGTRYGIRVDGAWNPDAGLRHNVNKLLLDPHATAIEGGYDWSQAVFAHDMNNPAEFDATDSAASTPRCVVTDPSFDWDAGAPDVAPRTPLAETVVYEVHVKGFTQQHPDVPEDIRGSYAGLAHPAAIKHLTDLGVTAVELLPVHQFVQDSHLEEKGLRNYWGYNSIGFFAPHGDYSSAGDGGGQVAEFKAMVKALHAAGLEVILDVVYNHTAEATTWARCCPSRASTMPPTTAWWRGRSPRTSIRPERATASTWATRRHWDSSWTHCATGSRKCTWMASASTWPPH
ncbi:alpha-amylase family glycosyl hydrolase [Arthrobacter oryzae]|uniref:alpha-amylase family glycosyl hydrolase n=1 Tax=Arthrobacter oryzae TaxID=409290 RepID=UPI002181EEED|nr:alpha-amylase family glycosyl hydrolase [Arthrobacter oryzae]